MVVVIHNHQAKVYQMHPKMKALEDEIRALQNRRDEILSRMNDDEYEAALSEVERLIEMDPKPGSKEDQQLSELSLIVERYEKQNFKFEAPNKDELIELCSNSEMKEDVIELIAKLISKWNPNDIKNFLEELAWEIDQVYPNKAAGYTSTFLDKAAFEISKINETGST